MPRESTGLVKCPRDARGRVLPIDAMARFAEKCRFDATTGCVLWTGGTTQGRGNSAVYGSFWYSGRRWFAHRWAAVHVHGYVLGDAQVGHTCPAGPNTLCVQHVEPQTQAANLAELNDRLAETRALQSNDERQHWLFVSLGICQPEPVAAPDSDGVPFHEPPAWLRPYLSQPETSECPF